MANKINPAILRFAVNSILSRYSNTRNLDNILQGGYHGADTFRNVWTAYGYPEQITFDNYWNMYLRCGVAWACVIKPVNKRWSIYPEVYDEKSEDDQRETDKPKTEFEIAVQRLIDEFDFWGVCRELDECQRIGKYAGVLIRAKEATQVSDLKSTPMLAANGVDSLVSLDPIYESQLLMDSSDIDSDMTSKRYGLPINYEYKEGDGILGSRVQNGVSIDEFIHWTRAFVYSETARGNGIVGRPALQPVFNSLMDWEKIKGAAAEGHFKNAKQRINNNITDPQLAASMFQSTSVTDEQDDYSKQIVEFMRGMNDTLDTAGVEVKTLQAAVDDPTGPANLSLQDICSGMEIPKTELIGFETGERSSTENANSWNVSNQAWRETKGTKLVVNFLQHLVDVGILPQPKERIYVEWPDIGSPSVEQRIENASKLTASIKSLNDSNLPTAAESIVKNLLSEVLDIDIEDEMIDEPENGRTDAEDLENDETQA